MYISDIYKKDKRSLSFEVFPPYGETEWKKMDDTLAGLCELNPDFISIVFIPGGSSKGNRTIELAKKIKDEYHVEPVVHLPSLFYDRGEIDAFAKTLTEAGIRNVLALRGDRNPEIPEKDDFQHASDLISYLKPKSEFCFMGACYPECHPESEDRVSEMLNLRIKVDAGAEVLLSQFFFENEPFFRFQEDCKIAGIQAPVIPGILPVIDAVQSRKMVSMCGAAFSQRFERMISKYEDNKEAMFDAGVSYAISQCVDLLTTDIRGIHIYTMNNAVVTRKICEGIGTVLCPA